MVALDQLDVVARLGVALARPWLALADDPGDCEQSWRARGGLPLVVGDAAAAGRGGERSDSRLRAPRAACASETCRLGCAVPSTGASKLNLPSAVGHFSSYHA